MKPIDSYLISPAAQVALLKHLWLKVAGLAVRERLFDLGFSSFDEWNRFEVGCCFGDELGRLPAYVRERSSYIFASPTGLIEPAETRRLAELKPWGTRFDDSEGIQLLKVLEARRTERFVLTRIEEEARWGPAIRSSETLFSKYFESLLTEEFSRLGFSSNLAFSSTGFPVVSRHLCGPWHVCWSAENKRLLANWPRERSGDIARWNTLRLRCFLASESFKGEPSVDLSLRDSSFVTLRLGQVVNGFDWAYSQINGVEQLRIILAAYAYLYSLVCPTLEDEIIGFLASS